MLQLELLHAAILAYVESLQQTLLRGDPAPSSSTVSLGRAHVQRALAMSGMPDNTRQQSAEEARLDLEHARAQGGSAAERLLHEQVSLIIDIMTTS